MGVLTLANISKHLTDDVIDRVFKLKTNSEDSVKNIDITRAAPAGEGLISAVYRIKVTGNSRQASFIVKGLVQDALLRKTLNCAVFFKREALFFSKILPILSEIQKSSGAKERIQSYFPECYSSHIDGVDDYLLLEDLSEKECLPISQHPTKRERDMILMVLAHFHSISHIMRCKNPDVLTKIANELSEVYYNDYNKDWYVKYLLKAISIDKDVLIEVEGKNSIYYKKFEEAVKHDVYDQLIKLSSTRGDYPTLSHGDAWCPNFLCCKDNAIAIDFQLVRCSSSALDLAYFIIMCSNLCHNKQDFLEAVEVYYRALEYYLKDMGLNASKVFSLDTLNDELKKYGRFGLLAALSSIPLMASERCDVLESFEEKFAGYDRIPLEKLWLLTPITSKEHRDQLVNAVRVAVDVGLI